MSADAFLVFYGVRVDFGNWEDKTIDYSKIEQLELDEHPLLVSAKTVELDTIWDNFSRRTEHYFLFIGKKIGVFGWEYADSISMTNDELQTIAIDVKAKLLKAKIEGEPKLWMQFLPDH